MSKNSLTLTTPVGRIVGGSLYDSRTTDSKGAPLVFKTGANAGQPRQEYSIGVAFPKSPGVQHWSQEAWLTPVWNLAHAAFPAGEAQHRAFSWKITDGDSQELNKKQKRPCDQEGYAGHWVIWFTDASKAPRVCDAKGTALITEKGVVKPRYFVQVAAVVNDNKPSESPGLYWQPTFVAFAGYGEEIYFGPSLQDAGFGGAALPPGASAAPLPGMTPPNAPGAPTPAPASVSAYPNAPVPAAPVYAPPARVMTTKAGTLRYEDFVKPGSTWTDALLISEGYMLPPPSASSVSASSVSAPAMTAPVPVVPNPAMAQIPVPGAAPVPAARHMLPAAGGFTYEQLMATGKWTDALLVQQGLMEAF